MAESKAEYARRIRAEGDQMRKEHWAEYKTRVAEITAKWKADFRAAKVENDRLQAELKEWHQLDLDQIRNYVIENLMRGAPFELGK